MSAGAVILAVWVLFPMYLLTAGAFSTQNGVYQYPKSLWPDWSTGTMRFFWDSAGVPAALGRSVIVAAITVALSMLIGTPAGYAIARYRFRGRNPYADGVSGSTFEIWRCRHLHQHDREKRRHHHRQHPGAY